MCIVDNDLIFFILYFIIKFEIFIKKKLQIFQVIKIHEFKKLININKLI